MVPKRKPKAQPKAKWRPCNLLQWREYAGLTQEVAAEKIGITHGQLSRIERGLSPWSQKILERAALEYQCTVVDLLAKLPPADIKRAS